MSLFGKLIGNAPGGGSSIGGVIGSGTEGSVLFLGAGGILAQDNANFFRSAAQLKFKTITESGRNGAVRFEFGGVGAVSGLLIKSTDAGGYSPDHIALETVAYGTAGFIGTQSTHGLVFNAYAPARFAFTAGYGGAAGRVYIDLATSAITDGLLKVNPGYAGEVGIRIKLAATPTADAFQVYASDGTTKLASITSAGKFSAPSGYGFANAGIGFSNGSQISSNGDGRFFFGSSSTDSSALISTPDQRVLVSQSVQFAWTSTSTAGAAGDTGLVRNAAGVIRITDGDTGIKGFLGGGANVASAAALPVPTGRIFHVTGTTGITSITSTNFQNGAIITLIFDGALTVTDGSNLKMAGNFTTAADDTLTLGYDGTNWYEICRSVN